MLEGIIRIDTPTEKLDTQEKYDTFLKAAKKKLGFPEDGNMWISCGDDKPIEYVWFKGNLYSREMYDGVYGHFTIYNDKNIKRIDTTKEVLCECGSTSFSLKYGCYEISAHCIECGKEDSVYSG